jgi:glutamyl endopeptidase
MKARVGVAVLIATGASALAVGLVITGPASAASDTSISDDGQEFAAANYASGMQGVDSSRGSDASSSSRIVSGSEFAASLKDKPVRAPVGIRSIIGTDDRFQVNETTAFPARAVVLIQGVNGSGRCTGWLISNNTVMTAGHCVAAGGTGAFYDRSTLRLSPGANGAARPFGTCTARRQFSVRGWVRNGKEQYDYGAIKLNCTTNVGFFGFWWQAAPLTDLFSRVSGYPGDKPRTQWQSTDSIRVTQSRQLFYQNDTVGGDRGGPVWRNNANHPFCNGQCAMAIHAYGLHGSLPHSTNNHGTRITESVFNNMISWREGP